MHDGQLKMALGGGGMVPNLGPMCATEQLFKTMDS